MRELIRTSLLWKMMMTLQRKSTGLRSWSRCRTNIILIGRSCWRIRLRINTANTRRRVFRILVARLILIPCQMRGFRSRSISIYCRIISLAGFINKTFSRSILIIMRRKPRSLLVGKILAHMYSKPTMKLRMSSAKSTIDCSKNMIRISHLYLNWSRLED